MLETKVVFSQEKTHASTKPCLPEQPRQVLHSDPGRAVLVALPPADQVDLRKVLEEEVDEEITAMLLDLPCHHGKEGTRTASRGKRPKPP